jgi:hypothetical protein
VRLCSSPPAYSGRARLGHIQHGLKDFSLSTKELKQLHDRASQGLEQTSSDLLKAANREVFSLNPRLNSMTSAELQRAHREAMAEASAASSGVEAEDHEEALRARRRKVEEALGWVGDAEAAFAKLLGEQKLVDGARGEARAGLSATKAELKRATEAAELAGVADVAVVKHMAAAARDAVRSAEEELAGNDVEGFQHAVGKAAYAVGELTALVEAEGRRKEEDDLRAEARGVMDQARARAEEIGREAEDAGLRQADAVASALQAVEAEIAAVSLLASGDPAAFMAAARAVISGPIEAAKATLRAERLRKEKNDQQRELELARLTPAVSSMLDVQAAIAQSFELAAEEALCAQVRV